jgi:RNA polymerase sigma-70 factor (ECF subfamily)
MLPAKSLASEMGAVLCRAATDGVKAPANTVASRKTRERSRRHAGGVGIRAESTPGRRRGLAEDFSEFLDSKRQMDDAGAIRACRAGQTDAFRHLVERYQAKALAHARVLTRDDADAADATQEAFVDAFRNLRAFDSKRPFYAWFYVLLRNRCFKQRTRRGTRSESGAVPESGRDPDVSEAQVDLWRAIGRLSPDDGELIVLKHLEGWTYDELSRAMHIPRGTVMSRLFAARQRLLALLSGETT